ncbi:hypothetical protein ElyMa_006408000 [Elysia marginata]|uniref:Uncharacterized protein n=1 Tax=Elysia marginata TaxID=1093978 RepID=A0AAV4HUD4_9GAST|nr:hypothetical protein ElyMa_006408000 [Elysia marginata]
MFWATASFYAKLRYLYGSSRFKNMMKNDADADDDVDDDMLQTRMAMDREPLKVSTFWGGCGAECLIGKLGRFRKPCVTITSEHSYAAGNENSTKNLRNC